jgi:hypothetical protein
MYASYTPENLLHKANPGSNWHLSSEEVGGAEWASKYLITALNNALLIYLDTTSISINFK